MTEATTPPSSSGRTAAFEAASLGSNPSGGSTLRPLREFMADVDVRGVEEFGWLQWKACRLIGKIRVRWWFFWNGHKPLPLGIYYSREHANFYRVTDDSGMGMAFWTKWRTRRDEFPQASPQRARTASSTREGL